MVDNVVCEKNPHQVDSAVCFADTYPLDGNLVIR